MPLARTRLRSEAVSSSSSPLTPLKVARRIFITSDWHLGGTPDQLDSSGRKSRLGTQICRSSRQLTSFIDWVREHGDGPDPVELVVNGDIVDFLAPEEGFGWASWLSEKEAIAKLDRIRFQCRGTDGRGPFEALRDFLRHPHCSLTLLLGNHDVELSLPAVRCHLRETVLESDGRGLQLIFDGEAYRRGQLLIEHGNRYDPWNQLRHSGLRQERSQRSRGLPVEEADRETKWFHPPAGTLLVAHAINHLLRNYPFINLLKPETDAMLPLLLSLQPDLWSLLDDIVFLRRIPARKRRAGLAGPTSPEDPQALGAPGSGTSIGSLEEILREQFGAEASLFTSAMSEEDGGELGVLPAVSPIHQKLRAKAAALFSRSRKVITLGRAWLSSDKKRREQVRAAFRLLANDQTWVINREGDPNYENAARDLVERGKFSHVIFGHTHLPKRIALKGPVKRSGYYLNSGAWADIIRLPEELASGGEVAESALDEFITKLEQGKTKDLIHTYAGFAEVLLNAKDKVLSAKIFSFGGRQHPRRPPLTRLQ